MRLNPFGNRRRSLPSKPRSAVIHDAAYVDVSVASEVPIVVIDPASAALLGHMYAQKRDLQLRGREITVTFTRHGASGAVKDPVDGWLIRPDDQLRQRLSTLDGTPGEYDFGSLAIVVEHPRG